MGQSEGLQEVRIHSWVIELELTRGESCTIPCTEGQLRPKWALRIKWASRLTLFTSRLKTKLVSTSSTRRSATSLEPSQPQRPRSISSKRLRSLLIQSRLNIPSPPTLARWWIVKRKRDQWLGSHARSPRLEGSTRLPTQALCPAMSSLGSQPQQITKPSNWSSLICNETDKNHLHK